MSENHTPTSRARHLRRNLTEEERILWRYLRNRRFMGLKFLRQHPIVYERINYKPLYFVPDFYCSEKKFIIEIDGKIHDFKKEYDERREEILEGAGLKVLRIKNEEFVNIHEVLKK